jgi:hypothetical protein
MGSRRTRLRSFQRFAPLSVFICSLPAIALATAGPSAVRFGFGRLVVLVGRRAEVATQSDLKGETVSFDRNDRKWL